MPQERPQGDERDVKRIKLSPQPLSFQILPTEILEQIVRNLELTDYVKLMHLNQEFLEMFDTELFYRKMWKGSYGPLIKAYRVPMSDDELMLGGWRTLLRRLRELNLAITQARKTMLRHTPEHYSLYNRSQIAIAVTGPLVQTFVCNKNYFLPLLHVAEYHKTVFNQKLQFSGFAPLIFHKCLSKSLLHLLNVAFALEFFQENVPNETKNIERCLFEISRFDFGFDELCITRRATMERVQQNVNRAISLEYTNFVFKSALDFEQFIMRVGTLAVQGLAIRELRKTNNILRSFDGAFIYSELHVLVIVKDILTNVLKRPFTISGRLFDPRVQVSRDHLIVGQRMYRYDFLSLTWVVSPADPERFITYEDALQLCKIPVSDHKPNSTESRVPHSESPTLWNATVCSMLRALHSTDQISVNSMIGNIIHDTKDVDIQMREQFSRATIAKPKFWRFPLSSIGGEGSDRIAAYHTCDISTMAGDLRFLSWGTLTFIQRKRSERLIPPSRCFANMSSTYLIKLMKLRCANYLGITLVKDLSTDFEFKYWASQRDGDFPMYVMRLRKDFICLKMKMD